MARRYDYTIQGFVTRMKEEPMNEQLNDVLRELLADNADILQWTSNPGVRLCLIYLPWPSPRVGLSPGKASDADTKRISQKSNPR